MFNHKICIISYDLNTFREKFIKSLFKYYKYNICINIL